MSEEESIGTERTPKNESIITLDATSIGKGRQLGGGKVTEKHLLFFGSNVLLALAVLMLAASATYFLSDEHHLQTGREIFEFAKTTLPPIATLILGFYFRGAQKSDRD